jgi:hypothetical protein
MAHPRISYHRSVSLFASCTYMNQAHYFADKLSIVGFEILVSFSAYFTILKMEAICSSETPADFQPTTWRYIPEDGTLQVMHRYILDWLHKRSQCVCFGTSYSGVTTLFRSILFKCTGAYPAGWRFPRLLWLQQVCTLQFQVKSGTRSVLCLA